MSERGIPVRQGSILPVMTNVNPDAQPELAEHAQGLGVRAIGRIHGVSHETARKTVLSQGSALIHDLERQLLIAGLMRDGGHEGEWPAIVIPPQQQADRMQALDMFSWAVKRLRERGWTIEIVTRTPPSGGAVFMITTPGGGST